MALRFKLTLYFKNIFSAFLIKSHKRFLRAVHKNSISPFSLYYFLMWTKAVNLNVTLTKLYNENLYNMATGMINFLKLFFDRSGNNLSL